MKDQAKHKARIASDGSLLEQHHDLSPLKPTVAPLVHINDCKKTANEKEKRRMAETTKSGGFFPRDRLNSNARAANTMTAKTGYGAFSARKGKSSR